MQEFSTLEEYKKIIEQSPEGDVIIFKHSTSCPISARAHAEVATFVDEHPDAAVYMMIVQDTPELKQTIAEELNVTHESPQIIHIQNGKVSEVLNHMAITTKALEDMLYS